jgi:hypothetical protein
VYLVLRSLLPLGEAPSTMPYPLLVRIGALLTMLGAAVAIVGTTILCVRRDLLHEIVMDEGWGGVDWTGRGALIWIPAAMLLLPSLSKWSHAVGGQYARCQVTGAWLITVYWSAFACGRRPRAATGCNFKRAPLGACTLPCGSANGRTITLSSGTIQRHLIRALGYGCGCDDC